MNHPSIICSDDPDCHLYISIMLIKPILLKWLQVKYYQGKTTHLTYKSVKLAEYREKITPNVRTNKVARKTEAQADTLMGTKAKPGWYGASMHRTKHLLQLRSSCATLKTRNSTPGSPDWTVGLISSAAQAANRWTAQPDYPEEKPKSGYHNVVNRPKFRCFERTTPFALI